MTEKEKELTANVEALLRHIAKNIRPCKACGVMLFFVHHANGRLAPYTVEAINHFANCPSAAQFKRKA